MLPKTKITINRTISNAYHAPPVAPYATGAAYGAAAAGAGGAGGIGAPNGTLGIAWYGYPYAAIYIPPLYYKLFNFFLI